MWYFLSVVGSIFNVVAAFQLFRAGNFIKSKRSWMVYIFIFIFCFAWPFKFNHWPRGSHFLLLFGSWFALAAFYLVYFIKKSKKQWSDVLKVVWIFTFFPAKAFRLFHWQYSDILSLISLVSIAIVYFHYIFFYKEIKDDSPHKVIDEKLLDQELID